MADIYNFSGHGRAANAPAPAAQHHNHAPVQQGPAVQLQTGNGFALPFVQKIVLGLGWTSQTKIDVDASALSFNKYGETVDIISPEHRANRDKSIVHSGDSEAGTVKDGVDAEKIMVNLAALQATTKFIIFTTSVYTPGANFSQLTGAYCRILDATNNNREICRYNLANSGNSTAVIFAKLHFENNSWFVTPLGEPANGPTALALEPQVRRFVGPVEQRANCTRVTVVSGTNLPALDSGKTSDPYVTVSCGQFKQKTPVIKKNLNPVWQNATFIVPGLAGDIINFSAFDSDLLTDDKMGDFSISLSEVPWDQEVTLNKNLSGKNARGSITVKILKSTRSL